MTKLVRGTVKRLCANKVGLDIRLDLVEGPMPEDDYFQLRHDHPNYKALYALALASAMNRLTLRIDTNEDIESTKRPTVDYLVQDW